MKLNEMQRKRSVHGRLYVYRGGDGTIIPDCTMHCVLYVHSIARHRAAQHSTAASRECHNV